MAAKPLLGQVEDFEALMKRVVKIESQLPDDSERAEEFAFFVKLKNKPVSYKHFERAALF